MLLLLLLLLPRMRSVLPQMLSVIAAVNCLQAAHHNRHVGPMRAMSLTLA
jgi:hypothetical protein